MNKKQIQQTKITFISSLLNIGNKKQNNVVNTLATKLASKNKVQIIHPNPYAPRIMHQMIHTYKQYTNIPKKTIIANIQIERFDYIELPKHALSGFLEPLIIPLNRKKIRKYTHSHVVHAHYCVPDGIIARYLNKKKNIPYCVSLRKADIIRRKRIRMKKLQDKILEGATYIHVLSPWIKENIPKQYWKKIVVIPHGVDMKHLSNKTRKNKILTISAVGELIALKHIEWIIKAVKNTNTNLKLQIIGDGPEKEKLENIAKTDKRITFLGKLSHEETLKKLETSHIFALPSKPETFGLVYLEAMAKRNAVIARKNSGVDGLFEENKEILIAKNYKDFEEKLIRLINNKQIREHIAEKGHKRVRKLTWSKIHKQYENMYAQIIKKEIEK